MVDSSLLGNDNNEIDITLPDSEADVKPKSPPAAEQKQSRMERRAAIAQARAIRRAAAAQERDTKRQAAAAAKAILAETEPEKHKRKAVRKPAAPHAVRQDSGMFHWLEQMRKPAKPLKDDTPQSSSDEIVAQIVAETAAKSDIPSAEAPSVSGTAVSETDVDAIVAEIVAEAESAAQERAAAEHPPAAEEITDTAAPLPAEESAVTETAAEEAALPAEEVITETVTTVIAVPIAPENDPLARARAAEIAHEQEKRRAAEHAAEMEQAAEQYQAETAEAKSLVCRLSRESSRLWKREAAAERVRLNGEKSARIAAKCNIAVCMVMLFGIAGGMLVLERPTVSEIENRSLATMPEFSWEDYLSGKYTNGVAEYYNDTVPFRSVFKNLTATFRQYMGLRQNAVLHNGTPVIDENTEPAVTTETTADPAMTVTTTTATTAVTTAAKQEEEGELSNNILIYEKRGIMLYGGSYSVGERYADSLNKFQQQLGDGVQVYSMVIPTPCSYYTPEEFQYLIGSEEKNIAHINENLQGVKPVDVYSVLEQHKAETIFMRTDHHWSALGAFYAAEAFSKAARVPFAPMSEYDKVVKHGYVGTLYGYSNDITLKQNPEDFFYYIPHANYTTTYYNTRLGNARTGSLLINLDNVQPVSWYLVYMGTDEVVTHVETEVKNGRTLAIFKDSYGNALVPWFTSSFEDIYVIDIRYFEVNAVNYLKQIGATDVLFAMNTFSATGGNSKKIEQIRTQGSAASNGWTFAEHGN